MLLRAIFLAMALALTGPAQPSPVQLPNDPRDLSIRKPKPLPLAAPKLPPLPLPPPPPIPIAFPIPFRALDPTGARPEPQNLHHRVDDTTITGPQNITITPTTSSFPTALATVPGTNEQNFGKDKDKDTEDDLIDGKKGCAEFTVIFARGTTESGNVGTSTGPPFFASLKKVVGAENVAVQGVDYPADIPGFLEGGSPDGSATMANLVQLALSKCSESTKVIMSGYSQGAQLVHNAAKILPASVMRQVAGAVLFGDPDDGQPVEGLAKAKTLVICHVGDFICDGTAIVTPAHLTYDKNAGEAANFVASREAFALYDRMPL